MIDFKVSSGGVELSLNNNFVSTISLNSEKISHQEAKFKNKWDKRVIRIDFILKAHNIRPRVITFLSAILLRWRLLVSDMLDKFYDEYYGENYNGDEEETAFVGMIDKHALGGFMAQVLEIDATETRSEAMFLLNYETSVITGLVVALEIHFGDKLLVEARLEEALNPHNL